MSADLAAPSPIRPFRPFGNKLLITGASGFLGWHLVQAATHQWQVSGTCHRHPAQIANLELQSVDLQDYLALKQLLAEVRPQAVIHAAALSNPNFCQQNPQTSYAINVTASVNLAGLCAEAEIPCIFTSTDLVFDGRQAPYREIDPVNPLNTYGEHKVQAEQGMLDRHPGVTIARLPLMFGVAPGCESFLQPFVKTLQAGKRLSLFTDEFRTPVSAATATGGLLLLLKLGFRGIVHLGGRERLSRYEFGEQLVELLQLPRSQLQPCRRADVPMSAPRPADVALDSRLAYGLGYNPPDVVAQLRQLVRQLGSESGQAQSGQAQA